MYGVCNKGVQKCTTITAAVSHEIKMMSAQQWTAIVCASAELIIFFSAIISVQKHKCDCDCSHLHGPKPQFLSNFPFLFSVIL